MLPPCVSQHFTMGLAFFDVTVFMNNLGLAAGSGITAEYRQLMYPNPARRRALFEWG